MPLRIYLAGRVGIEDGPVLVTEDRLPGRQGRLVFAMLAAEHRRPVDSDELAEELWGDCYQLRLPADTHVDLEAAEQGLHEAETALRAGDPRTAYGPAHVALYVTERPFLPGESGSWATAKRAELQALHVRALHADHGNPAEALRAYERCRRTLAKELGINPSPVTEALYAQILRSA
jgi:hypothetical protein